MKKQNIRLIHDELPPFGYRQANRSTGMIIELLEAILTPTNIYANYITVAMQTIQDALEYHKADGLAFLAVTPERRQHFQFSQPLVNTGGGLFVPADTELSSDPDWLAGKAIATPSGGPLIGYLRHRYPSVTISPVNDYSDALKAVIEGHAIAAALNVHAGQITAHRIYPGQFVCLDKFICSVDLAVAVIHGKHFQLIETVNRGLVRLHTTGEYDQIISRWQRNNTFDPFLSHP